MFGHDQHVNNHHSYADSQALQNIQRKISKQKNAAEHRTDQMNGHRLFESPPPPRIPHSTSLEFEPLRHSAGSRSLHTDNDVILTNDFNHPSFHPPHSRKVTKVAPKENHSISNSRPVPARSSSASSALPTKHENRNSALTPSDIQRLKNVRRHEPAHVPSGPESKKSLITPDSWKSYPVVIKPRANKKPPPTVVNKPVRREKTPDPVREQPSPVVPEKPIVEKPKPHRSTPKPKVVEPPPEPKVVKKEKTKEELEKIHQYIQEKRREHEHILTHEKQLKQVQERERKDKLKKLNEQIKKVAQQPLPPALVKKLKSNELITQDQSEQTRDRLLELLGPRMITEPPAIFHPNTPFEPATARDRSLSSSSSSSSSDSIVEIQPPRIEQSFVRPRSEQFNQTEQRQQNLLRWALNLTQGCNDIEDKLKYLRPDGTQPFDLIPASRPNLQHDDGNLRAKTPILITNNSKPVEPIVPSKVLRPSGRLIKLNQNRTSEYQGQNLPGVGNLRDPLLEQRIKRDRAAAKIQAAYRGYTVRKSIHWLNDHKQRANNQSNRRSTRRSPKPPSHPTDLFDPPALNLDIRMPDDNFTIGSTLLRQYQRNGVKIISSVPSPFQPEKMPHSTPLQTYSDDYEDMTSTKSATPIQQTHKPEKSRPIKQSVPERPQPIRQPTPEKPRIIQQPLLSMDRSSSRTSSTSTSTSVSFSTTPTPTPEPTNIPHRRSISPPLPPQISSDNGRPIRPPQSLISGVSRRVSSDERRYSPDALERQLNAELHLLDGVEASMKQVDNMERLRSVALAQQEVVSLAQVIQTQKSAVESPSEQRIRKPARREVSSSLTSSTSSSSTDKNHGRSGRRETASTSSSSETILTARERRTRQKFHSEAEFQAYEKRLKDVEQKIRSLDKRATDILVEKRPPSSPHVPARSNSESSISEDLPVSHKSSNSRSTAADRKNSNGISEIKTESYSTSFEQDIESSQRRPSVDAVTTDGSDIERRIRTYQDQVQKKKTELDQLKQRKNKETLRRREEELKKQLESYNHQIETLRTEPVVPKLATPPRKSPAKRSTSSSSSSSSTSTPTKPQESSIAEDLPVSSTPSQSKTNNIIGKQTVVKKQRDFFDDEEEEEKPAVIKPLETPRDERDTQHDALSLSIATDIASETDNDDSRRPSTDIDKPILNLNTNLPPPKLKPNDDFDSSSSSSSTTTTSKKSSKIPSIERKSSPVVHDYDEDFSDLSQSPSTPIKEPVPKQKLDEIDVESIQEDLEEKPSLHDTNQSSSSKSSGDEQSEILVLVKKSANTTPRRQEDKTLEDDFPPPPPPSSLPPVQPSLEGIYNDDTSHDVSEDEEVNEQENRVDQLTDSFLRTFIDEAIDQGHAIQRLKGENNERNLPLTQDAEEWISKEDSAEEEYLREPSEPNEFEIDLSGLGEKNTDEPRVESPRKPVIEEPIKPLIPHTREQVIHVCDEALKILLDQNSDFSNRSTIRCRIPPSYFTTELQNGDSEDTRRNHHAYCQMIFDLSVEILHEMDLENVQAPDYPEWQKAKLVSKRFYRGRKPTNRREIEQIVRAKLLELLNVTPRPVNYSKWRVFNNRRPGIEKFESVLDEEIRRNESEWINYDGDCTQMKFDIADGILDQLIQETLNECLTVVNKRFYLNSNSTRL